MSLGILCQSRREIICLKWTTFGLYVFLSAFFWASGSAPLRSAFYLFLIIPFLLVLPWRQFCIKEYGGRLTISALIFAAYSVMASLWGNSSDFDDYIKEWLFLAFWLTGVSWLFYNATINMHRVYTFIACVGFIFSLVTVFVFYIYEGNSLGVRLNGLGLAENPTIVAQVFGVAALLAYMSSIYASKWVISSIYFIISMVCILPMVLSQSRGAALGFIFSAVAALLIIRPKATIWLSHAIVAFIAITLLFWLTDIEHILAKRGVSFSFRDVIWIELCKRIPEHLFFGIGLESNARILISDVGVFHHAHNSWLDVFYYSGLVGLLLALLHVVLILRCFTQNKNILPVYLWLIYGCICLFTNGTYLLTPPDAQWLMYWVPADLLTALTMSPHQCQKK